MCTGAAGYAERGATGRRVGGKTAWLWAGDSLSASDGWPCDRTGSGTPTGVRFIFVEKIDDKLVLRRGFKIAPDEKLIIVEDVITKGGRVVETIAIALEHQADVSAVGVVVDRSNGTVDVGAPMECLLPMEVETFDPENLPEDLQAIPAVKPGS